MKSVSSIVGLFFSDEINLVYENIKFSGDLSPEKKEKLKILPFKFLGPLFLTAASTKEKNWKIEVIESSLSQYQETTIDVDVTQSFFNLNSSIESEDGKTNLFALIGSPYTEDIKVIYDKIVNYIHPSIIQGKIVNESFLGGDFSFKDFIEAELIRGVNLIERSLGSSRKIYSNSFFSSQKFYCVGFMERKKSDNIRESYLYTCDFDDPLKNIYLNYVPSYYMLAILPDYYENRIIETLSLLNKTTIFPNIRAIRMSYEEKKVIYLEEFLMEKNIKKSYGVILIPDNKNLADLLQETGLYGGGSPQMETMSFYKKKLRQILDKNKNLEETIVEINPNFDPFKKWKTDTEEGLSKIKNLLDNNI
ncbi:MAG: hypothetical protein ACTSRI_00355 [Promethearchaeota archaeon]